MNQSCVSYEEKIKNIVHKLNQIYRQETDLFASCCGPAYLRLSDLSNWYPKIFSLDRPIDENTIQSINQEIKSAVPRLSNIYSTHILNTKEDYSLVNQIDKTISTIKKGNNQRLSPIVCEHLFRYFNPNAYDNNTSIEQAYFLSQTKNISDISNLAQKIQIEQIRARISGSSKQLWSTTVHSYAATKQSPQEIWSLLWRTFYDTQSMQDLRDSKNIKTSPIDYMKIETLYFIDDVINSIIQKCLEKRHPTINDVKFATTTTANRAREYFSKTTGTTPEKCLLTNSIKNIPEQVQKIRKQFWQENYPVSLR